MEGTTRLDPIAGLKQEFGLQERSLFAHEGLSFVNHKVCHNLSDLFAHSCDVPEIPSEIRTNAC